MNNHESDVLILFSENEDSNFIEELMRLYTPYKVLGKGAFSSVFQAKDYQGIDVAIKVFEYLTIR